MKIYVFLKWWNRQNVVWFFAFIKAFCVFLTEIVKKNLYDIIYKNVWNENNQYLLNSSCHIYNFWKYEMRKRKSGHTTFWLLKIDRHPLNLHALQRILGYWMIFNENSAMSFLYSMDCSLVVQSEKKIWFDF